jgi:shikimate dehydrogenase
MKLFGLIGYPLGHSFSEKFFTEKFQKENIHACYKLFPIENIQLFHEILEKNPTIEGLNVTIPYKEQIVPYLDELDKTAAEIGAVNVIKIKKDVNQVKLIGYNSDIIGFEQSIRPLLTEHHKKALILGTGGASKGVAYVLKKLNIDYTFVSRNKNVDCFTYEELNKEIINSHTLIVNCSPIGTYPNTQVCPNIPYEGLSKQHLLYDLIYNPEKTLFLKKGEMEGATIKNGLEMLHKQAISAWEIWNQ